MKFLIDTNVISELRKGDRADAKLSAWFAGVDSDDLAVSVLVIGEIRLGILRLERKDSAAAARLAAWLTRVERAYAGRTFPVDADVVEIWARLNAVRTLPVIDSLLAATALAHGLTLVTRNVNDLSGVTVPLVNPFA